MSSGAVCERDATNLKQVEKRKQLPQESLKSWRVSLVEVLTGDKINVIFFWWEVDRKSGGLKKAR